MDQDFTQELIEIFKSEAEDYLNILNNGLLELEENPTPELLEQIYRTTHSLKGAARAVNYSGIEELCQVMETIFSRIKNGEMKVTPEILDVLLAGVEELSEIINSDDPDQEADYEVMENLQKILKGESPKKAKAIPEKEEKKKAEEERKEPAKSEIKTEAQPEEAKQTDVARTKSEEPKQAQKNYIKPKEKPSPKKAKGSSSTQSETIRVSFERISHLMNQSEELLMIKLKNDHYVQNMRELNDLLQKNKHKCIDFLNQLQSVASHYKQSSSAETKQNEQLNQMINTFNTNLQYIFNFEKKLLQFYATLENDNHQVASLIEHHLTDIRQLMMFPFSTITNYLQTSTRSIARELKKQIDLKIIGGEIELDKHVLEELKDPLIHIIRNSIDHGIEHPEERVAKGKPEKGRITIEVLPPREQNIVIRISDDGKGIDLEKVKQSALSKNLVQPEELQHFSESQILGLIFKSGFSTAQKVSRLSGRGLGMAVVAENVEKLGGTVKIENNAPFGCSFVITLPLNMATSRGILIEVSGLRYIIPTRIVETPLRIEPSNLRSVEGSKVISVNGRNIPVFELASLLKLKPTQIDPAKKLNILILNWAQKRMALIVDRILDEREILLKRLNPPLEEVRFLAGATILGDGSLVPVLNTGDLFRSGSDFAGADVSETASKKKKILVVEDSITSRVLLKNVLEGAGYEVITAINGAQAWEILQKEKFDLIVSDVEMPEMNGFELTRNVRKNEKLQSIPLILLTSLGSEEDRKKGMESGATAYFIKSSFEQKSLLELIEKLI